MNGNGNGVRTEDLLLGAIIRCPHTLALVAELEPRDFEYARGRFTFEAVRELEARGIPIDVSAVLAELAARGNLEALSDGRADGAAHYLGDIVSRTPDEPEASAVIEVAATIRARSAAVTARLAAIEEAERTENEIDDIALREAEPPDPWPEEVAKALDEVKARLAAGSSAARPPLFQTDVVELLQKTFDGPRWLVTGLITRGAIVVIGAEPKAAKTWLATEIAVAIASGTPVCGEFYAEQGRVAYFYAEDRDVEVKSRVRALLAGAGRRIESGRLFAEPRGSYLDIVRDQDLARVVASVRRIGPIDLLVLDPLRDLHSGEEDKSDAMRDVMRRLRVIGELLGCAVAVVHHAIKTSKETSKRRPGQNLRGSSAIHGATDVLIDLRDTAGDEMTTFTNTVSSQIKGARSAGRFKITLTIADNEAGEALSATWTVERTATRAEAAAAKRAEPVTTPAALQKEQDDTRALWFIKGLPKPLSMRALREHEQRPMSERRMRAAIDRLLDSGKCTNQAGVIVPGSSPQLEVVHHA